MILPTQKSMKISAKHMRFGSGFRGIREESGKITEHLQTNAKFESQTFVFGTVQNCVDLVDLIKSFPTIFSCKIRRRHSQERALRSSASLLAPDSPPLPFNMIRIILLLVTRFFSWSQEFFPWSQDFFLGHKI